MLIFQRAAVLARLNCSSYPRLSYANNCKIIDSFGKAVHIDSSKVRNTNLIVETKWQETCNFRVLDGNYITKMQQNIVAQLPVVVVSSESEERVDITADIPEQHDLMISGSDMQLQLKNKLLGDLSVVTMSGSITVDKVKGESVLINSPKSSVVVKKSVEGGVHFECESLTAKMFHSNLANITTSGKLQVEALYSDLATLKSSASIEIGLLRGEVKAQAQNSINIAGVDGAFHIVSQQGDVKVQINSLSLNGPHFIQALAGKATCWLNPHVVTQIKCEAPSKQAISIVSEAYEPLTSLANESSSCIIEGLFTRQVAKAPSRYNSTSSSSGKIDLNGAARQAQAKRGNDNQGVPSDKQDRNDKGVIHIKAKEIEVRTMSWMDVIKAKHGFS